MINANPPNPVMKLIPNLSKPNDVMIEETVKRGIDQTKNLWSFRKNGKTSKKIPKGIIKNWSPPHADKLKIRKIPAEINFGITNLCFLDFIPLKKRYSAKILKNIPSGSDLNQPIWPRIIIGKETEKSNDAKSPAVVPPITLTNAKITITVNEPNTTGNKIAKS